MLLAVYASFKTTYVRYMLLNPLVDLKGILLRWVAWGWELFPATVLLQIDKYLIEAWCGKLIPAVRFFVQSA
jgi:hypothetical protein